MNCFLMMMEREVLRCFEEEQIKNVDNEYREGDGDRNYSWLKGIQRRRGKGRRSSSRTGVSSVGSNVTHLFFFSAPDLSFIRIT